MKDLTKEEFMKIGMECVDNRVTELLKEKGDTHLLLLFTMVGFDIVQEMRDKLFEKEGE